MMKFYPVSLCLMTILGFSTDNSLTRGTFVSDSVRYSFNDPNLGFVRVSPPGLAQVCEGKQLQLTCTTNEPAKVWNFVPPLINNQGVSIPQDWFVSITDLSQQPQYLMLNSTNFTVVRTSMRNSSPLVSTMTIVNSSSALNMKNISCTNIIDNQFAMSAIATILVIGETHTGII